ncbi:unnamed protein product [Paramecium pentaurelia]|uniref:Uncharacterized protein n=1 Tax=Paramecium pentaurelia TaxID=43138 RepID=A0A8S1VDE6_9CILI|nr:unnamed protein product [Paramecium pentaurelia]
MYNNHQIFSKNYQILIYKSLQVEKIKYLIQIINNVEELINQAKAYQRQSNLFEQIVTLYQQQTNKIDQIQQNTQNWTKDQIIKSGSINASFQNLSQIFNDYTITIDNKSKQQNFVIFNNLRQIYSMQQVRNNNLEVEDANLLIQISMSSDQKQQEKFQKYIKD